VWDDVLSENSQTEGCQGLISDGVPFFIQKRKNIDKSVVRKIYEEHSSRFAGEEVPGDLGEQAKSWLAQHCKVTTG